MIMMENIKVYDDFFSEELRQEIWDKMMRPKWNFTGGNGAAIRRTSNSIKWAFGSNSGTVTGSGAGGQGESPDGVS